MADNKTPIRDVNGHPVADQEARDRIAGIREYPDAETNSVLISGEDCEVQWRKERMADLRGGEITVNSADDSGMIEGKYAVTSSDTDIMGSLAICSDIGDYAPIMWDGKEYDATVTKIDQATAYGNQAVVDESAPDTGEPFCIIKALTEAYIVVVFAEAGEHTLAMPTARPLDEKYVPRTIARKAEVDKLSEENALFSTELDIQPAPSKNLNTTQYYTQTKNGVTFTVNADNSVTLAGTYTSNVSIFSGPTENKERGFELPAGTYMLSGGVDGYVNIVCYLYGADGALISETVDYGYNKEIIVSEDCLCCITITARANKTMDGITVKAQLEAGTVATEYVSPFSEDNHSARLDNIESRISEIENSSGGLVDEVPSYWEKTSGYLTGKVETIRTLMRGCAERGDIFYFLTDAHWHLNEKHSPAIIAWLNEHINVPRMINGGDITDEYDEEPSRLYRKAMGNGEYYFVDGNHEFLASKTYADNFYANRMFADKAVYGDENRTYYYVDNPAGKMRYIVLATFGPWVDGSESMVLNTTEQKEWLKNVALNVEDGWTVIVFAHIYSIENGNYIDGGETMLSYMADMTKGEVACVIQGDQHSDYILPSYADKIPIVCTTCDKNKNADVEDVDSRPSGTINEQAFDVVVLDKAQKQLHFVRIGYAKDGDEIRTVSYGTAN